MQAYHDLATFLISSWRLANPDRRMPTSHGILDAALESVRDKLPGRMAEVVTFGDTRVGRRCYELDTVLYCARTSNLISDPNPSYTSADIQITEDAARRLIRRAGLDIESSKAFGKALAESVDANSEVAA